MKICFLTSVLFKFRTGINPIDLKLDETKLNNNQIKPNQIVEFSSILLFCLGL